MPTIKKIVHNGTEYDVGAQQGSSKYRGPVCYCLGNNAYNMGIDRPNGSDFAQISKYSCTSSDGYIVQIKRDGDHKDRRTCGFCVINQTNDSFCICASSSACYNYDIVFYGTITNISATTRSFGTGAEGTCVIDEDTVLEAREYNFDNLTICAGKKLSFCGQGIPVIRVKNNFVNEGEIDLYNPFICDSTCVTTDYSGIEIKNNVNNYYECALFLKEEILDKFSYDYLRKAACGGSGGSNRCSGITAGAGGAGGLDGNGSSGGCVYVSGAGYCTGTVGGSGGSGTADAGGGGGSGASRPLTAGNRGGNGANGIGGCGANSADKDTSGGGGGGGFGCLKGGDGGYGGVGGNGGNSYLGDGGKGGDAHGYTCGTGSRTAPGHGGCSYYGNGGDSGIGGYSCYSSAVYGCGGCSVYGNGGFGSTHGGHSIYGNGGSSFSCGGWSLYGEGGCGGDYSGYGRCVTCGKKGCAFGGNYGIGLFAKRFINDGVINGKGGDGTSCCGIGASGSSIYVISCCIEGDGTVSYTGGSGATKGSDGVYKTFFVQ